MQREAHFTTTSDYDLLGVRSAGPVERDARLWEGVYLDIFVFPEVKLNNPDQSLVYMLGGKVLVEQGDIGTRFLNELQGVFDRGPEPVSAAELKVKRVWCLTCWKRRYQYTGGGWNHDRAPRCPKRNVRPST